MQFAACLISAYILGTALASPVIAERQESLPWCGVSRGQKPGQEYNPSTVCLQPNSQPPPHLLFPFLQSEADNKKQQHCCQNPRPDLGWIVCEKDLLPCRNDSGCVPQEACIVEVTGCH